MYGFAANGSGIYFSNGAIDKFCISNNSYYYYYTTPTGTEQRATDVSNTSTNNTAINKR